MSYTKTKTIDVKEVSLDKLFIHYTDIDNLEDILANGLEPRIGENSAVVEKSKKVFFTVGGEGALMIMDVWLRWLRSRPKNKYIYKLGAFLLTKPYFPKFVYDVIFSKWHKSDRKLKSVCKMLSKTLDNSVYLVLDLEEGEDFSFDDVDEVKAQRFARRHLEYFYPNHDKLCDGKIEYWNMHTFSNKVIESHKISVFEIDGDRSAQKILEYLFAGNRQFVEENCPTLVKYFAFVAEEVR